MFGHTVWVLPASEAAAGAEIPVTLMENGTVYQLLAAAAATMDFGVRGVRPKQLQATFGGRVLGPGEPVSALGADPRVVIGLKPARPTPRSAPPAPAGSQGSASQRPQGTAAVGGSQGTTSQRQRHGNVAVGGSQGGGSQRQHDTAAPSAEGAADQPASHRRQGPARRPAPRRPRDSAGSTGLTDAICDQFLEHVDGPSNQPATEVGVEDTYDGLLLEPLEALLASPPRARAASPLRQQRPVQPPDDSWRERPPLPPKLLRDIRRGVKLRKTGLIVKGEWVGRPRPRVTPVVEVADAAAAIGAGIEQERAARLRRRSASRSRARSEGRAASAPRLPKRRRTAAPAGGGGAVAQHPGSPDARPGRLSDAWRQGTLDAYSKEALSSMLAARGLPQGGSKRSLLQRVDRYTAAVMQHQPLHPIAETTAALERAEGPAEIEGAYDESDLRTVAGDEDEEIIPRVAPHPAEEDDDDVPLAQRPQPTQRRSVSRRGERPGLCVHGALARFCGQCP
eukprot:TRINITY_DN3351_c0_g1_i1.p1 TRINITY_DN3351_c0_g1~~TRINITY_DN3351_c0_g1_i1.p1  ORF type:complete len:536 (+),score=138.99 TRINITY_DN3351_c0_g1_i1:83-1609(+)